VEIDLNSLTELIPICATIRSDESEKGIAIEESPWLIIEDKELRPVIPFAVLRLVLTSPNKVEVSAPLIRGRRSAT
jgi:hypothetical protein